MLLILCLFACESAPEKEQIYGHWQFDYDKTIQYRKDNGYDYSDIMLYMEELLEQAVTLDKDSGMFAWAFSHETPIHAPFELTHKGKWYALTVPEANTCFRHGELLMHSDGFPEETMVMSKK